MSIDRRPESNVQYPWSRGWEWVNQGTEMFLAAPGVWILLLILQLIVGFGISFWPTPEGFTGAVADLSLELVGVVLNVFFDAGLLLGCASLKRGKRLRISTLFAAFRHPTAPAVLLLAVIQILAWIALAVLAVGLAAVVLVTQQPLMEVGADALVGAILRSLGSTFAIVLVVLTLALLFAMALWMAAPLVLFRGFTPSQALIASFNVNFRNVRALTIYGLGMGGLALVAALPLLLGFLVWIPLTTTSRYAAFRDLFPADEPVTVS
jgi:uncharacterized membrane protein